MRPTWSTHRGLGAACLIVALIAAARPAAAAPRPAAAAARDRRPTIEGVVVPADAERGFPLELLFSRLPDGRLAGHYAVDGHVHSTASPDARLTLPEIAAAGRGAGLDAVVITDHCSTGAGPRLAALGGGAPLLVLGEEAGTRDAHVGLWHLPGPRGDWLAGAAPLGCLAGRIDTLAPGALSVLNHPTWGAVGAARFAPATFDPRLPGPKLDAIEIWNAEARFRGRTREVIRAWEEMLERGLRPAIVSGTDAHRRAADIGSVRTIVIAPALEAGALAESARLGRTYVTDDARLTFTVAGHGLGEVIDGSAGAASDPARGPWRVAVRGLSHRGGELRLLAGRTVLATRPLAPGESFAFDRDVDPRAFGRAAGWLRVEIVRQAGVSEEVALVTSPIYYELDHPGAHWAARPRDGAVAAAPRPGRALRLALARCAASR